MVILIFFTKLIYLSCSFIKYKKYVKFMNKFIFTLSNEVMTSDGFWQRSWEVIKLFIWICLGLQSSIWNFLCRVFLFDSRWRSSLPSVKKTLGKDLLCQVFFYSRQRNLFAKCFFLLSVFYHFSTNHLTLSKELDFGSVVPKLEWGGVWDCSTNSTVEQLHKKLEFVKYLFRCSHNSTLFPRTECVELKPFG
jgi:hypothetical protein